MKESEPSVFSSIEDETVVVDDLLKRPMKWMNLLLAFSLVVILTIATLLILDYLIPTCISTIRPCQTNSDMKWMASKEKLTREESKEFCQS
jgi:capsular polysaccharide biosynthesis protein